MDISESWPGSVGEMTCFPVPFLLHPQLANFKLNELIKTASGSVNGVTCA